MSKHKIAKMRESSAELSRQVREKIVGYIVAAFGLVAGLAWNDAVKAAIESVFPAQASSLWARFGYAIFISVVVVVISINLLKITQLDKDEK